MQDQMIDDDLDLLEAVPVIDVSALSVRAREVWDKQQAFLAAYAEYGTIRKAAPIAGVDRFTERFWRRHDVLDYAQRFQDAEQEHREKVQGIMLDRVETPEGNRGSDGLLSHYGNAIWPDKFRDRPEKDDDTQKKIAEALFKLAAQDRERIEEWNTSRAKVIEGDVRVVDDEAK